MIQGFLHLEVERRGSGNDAVEIVRVTLCFDQRLATAVRAATEVGILRFASIECGDQFLRGQRSEVHTTMGEIGAFLWVIAKMLICRQMAHVGRGHRECASTQGYAAISGTHGRVDVATQPAAADLQVTLLPGAGWQLEPEVDLRSQPGFHSTHRNTITGRLTGRQHTTALPAEVTEIHAAQCSTIADRFDHCKPGCIVGGRRGCHTGQSRRLNAE